MLPFLVCLFVCLSVTFVHCAHTAEDIYTVFAYDSSMSPQIVLKIGSHRSTTSFPAKLWPNVTHPVDLNDVGDIRRQTAAEWLQIAHWSQWRKPPSLFRMITIADPLLSLSTKMGLQLANAPLTRKSQVRDECCHLANMIEERCRLFSVDKLLWTLFSFCLRIVLCFVCFLLVFLYIRRTIGIVKFIMHGQLWWGVCAVWLFWQPVLEHFWIRDLWSGVKLLSNRWWSPILRSLKWAYPAYLPLGHLGNAPPLNCEKSRIWPKCNLREVAPMENH